MVAHASPRHPRVTLARSPMTQYQPAKCTRTLHWRFHMISCSCATPSKAETKRTDIFDAVINATKTSQNQNTDPRAHTEPQVSVELLASATGAPRYCGGIRVRCHCVYRIRLHRTLERSVRRILVSHDRCRASRTRQRKSTPSGRNDNGTTGGIRDPRHNG